MHQKVAFHRAKVIFQPLPRGVGAKINANMYIKNQTFPSPLSLKLN
jgi:hypothetical protein